MEKIDTINKADLIDLITEESGLLKKDATTFLNAFLEVTTKAFKEDKAIRLIGYGNFEVKKRAARQGRNPRKPEEVIHIPSSKTVTFKIGKGLKDSIQ